MACVATVIAKMDKEDLEKFNEIERTIKGLGKEINDRFKEIDSRLDKLTGNEIRPGSEPDQYEENQKTLCWLIDFIDEWKIKSLEYKKLKLVESDHHDGYLSNVAPTGEMALDIKIILEPKQ